MKSLFDKLNLRPFERRLIVAIAVVLFAVLNIVFVWPHFKDWGDTRDRLEGLRGKLQRETDEIVHKDEFEKKARSFEAQGASVAAEDQANQFLQTVRNQAAVSGVSIIGNTRPSTTTNEFFLEQHQTFQVQATEEQLVDFLYSLGSAESVIRARGLSFRPNAQRQQLSGNIDLVASYQKTARKAATPAAAPAGPIIRTAPKQTSTPTTKKP